MHNFSNFLRRTAFLHVFGQLPIPAFPNEPHENSHSSKINNACRGGLTAAPVVSLGLMDMNNIPDFDPQWHAYQHLFQEIQVPAKTTLLREGEVARQAYYIQQGCLRLWFNDNGREITFQFFFESQGVSSMESFRTGRPSLFNLETIEPCTLLIITKTDFQKMLAEAPGFKETVEQHIYQRLEHYFALFLSRIRDTPQQRWLRLLEEHPRIVQRIPQHLIASYLGITPVSLSRIRARGS